VCGSDSVFLCRSDFSRSLVEILFFVRLSSLLPSIPLVLTPDHFPFFLSTAAGPDLGLARLATLNLFVVSCFGCQAGHRTLASRVGSCYKSWSCALGHTILLCVFRSAREVNTWAAHGLLLATQVFGVLKLFRQDSSFLHPAPVFKFLSLFHI
jgi:hypothetical protein